MSINTKEFLKLLENQEIRDAILKISEEDSNNKSSEKEIKMLKDLIEKLKKTFSNEKSKLEDDIKEAKSKKEIITKGINELELRLKDAREEIQKYKKPFEKQLEVYDLYQNLNDTTKFSLQGIFKDDSLSGFFACGVQEKNIDSFWEYIKSELMEDKNGDIDSLISIFDFLLSQYLMAYPIYQIQEIANGENFNTDKHIKHSTSAVSGAISKVLFKGWINSKNSKIIKKSVVRV